MFLLVVHHRVLGSFGHKRHNTIIRRSCFRRAPSPKYQSVYCPLARIMEYGERGRQAEHATQWCVGAKSMMGACMYTQNTHTNTHTKYSAHNSAMVLDMSDKVPTEVRSKESGLAGRCVNESVSDRFSLSSAFFLHCESKAVKRTWKIGKIQN